MGPSSNILTDISTPLSDNPRSTPARKKIRFAIVKGSKTDTNVFDFWGGQKAPDPKSFIHRENK